MYFFKFKDRTFLFVDSKRNGGFVLEIVYHNGWANGMDTKIGGTTSLTGDRLNKLFNISEIGLDPIDIIKLYI